MFIFSDEEGNLICKHCTHCGLILARSNFSPNGRGPNKVRSMCRHCRNLEKRGLDRNQRHIDFWKDAGIPLKCYICSGPFEEVEHVRSIALGGPDILINTLPACVQCNRGIYGKQDRPLCEWLRKERSEYLELVISKVLSYGVDPFTGCEKVSIEVDDIASGRWILCEIVGNREFVDVTDDIMEESYRIQRDRFM